MALIPSVTVGERIIELYTFQGEVVDEKKWATTQVSGSGGGINAGSGQPNPVTIASTTTTHDQFFLRNDSGQELAVELANAGIALRKGHWVTVLWGAIKGYSQGSWLAVYNHTTGNLTPFPAAVDTLAIPPLSTSMLLLYVASVFGFCFYGLGIIVLAVLLFQRAARKKQLRAALRPAVDAAISQIKNAGI